MTAQVLTSRNRVLNDHIKYTQGTKTVCVSACLNYLGIAPDTYNYTSSKKNRTAYENVIRSNGMGVRSRATEFKLKKSVSTLTEIKTNIRKSDYNSEDLFIVLCGQKKAAHLILVNGKGETVIDTAPKCKWKVESIKQIIFN